MVRYQGFCFEDGLVMDYMLFETCEEKKGKRWRGEGFLHI
jgi:hypothetical protein